MATGDYDMDGFKPIKNEKTVISIRIDRDMLEVLDGMAYETDISRNEMIIQCIDYALKNSKTKTG
jgi:metal-responsive CopG/Arc/MetJ family transcriptional regulator